MNLYEIAIQQLLAHPQAKQWPELQTACKRALGHRPVAWHFPARASEAMGADASESVPAIGAVTCAHMAIMLVDDMLDEDPRGIYHKLGMGRTANLAAGLYGLGMTVLLGSHCAEQACAVGTYSWLMLRTAYGQDLDVHNSQTEEGYWAVAQAKSSPYFATALSLGALLGGANKSTAEGFHRFGEIYGEIMQIHDDLNDCLETPANVDWLLGRSPLPILFAQLVEHPDRRRFRELRTQVAEPAALEEAQTILVRCGAISYCVSELTVRHKQATALLATLDLPDPRPLEQLLDEAIAPVQHLFSRFAAVG